MLINIINEYFKVFYMFNPNFIIYGSRSCSAYLPIKELKSWKNLEHSSWQQGKSETHQTAAIV